MPTHCPACGTELRAGEGGRRRHPLPQRPRPARRSCASGCSTWPAAARFDIEVLGYEAAAALLDAGVDHRRGRPVRPRPRTTLRDGAPFFTNKDGALSAQRAASCWTTSRRPSSGRCGGCWSRCRSGTSARPRPRRWPASSARSTRSRRPPRRSWPRSTASARPSPRRSREWFAVDWHREIVAQVARGRGPDGGGARPTTGPRPLDGLTVVVTGTLDDFSRDEAGRGAARAAAARSTGSVSKKTASSWSATTPGCKYDKAVSSKRADPGRGRLRGAAGRRGPTPPARWPRSASGHRSPGRSRRSDAVAAAERRSAAMRGQVGQPEQLGARNSRSRRPAEQDARCRAPTGAAASSVAMLPPVRRAPSPRRGQRSRRASAAATGSIDRPRARARLRATRGSPRRGTAVAAAPAPSRRGTPGQLRGQHLPARPRRPRRAPPPAPGRGAGRSGAGVGPQRLDPDAGHRLRGRDQAVGAAAGGQLDHEVVDGAVAALDDVHGTMSAPACRARVATAPSMPGRSGNDQPQQIGHGHLRLPAVPAPIVIRS